ncbi:hypothetical protein CSUI_007535 [Cystoisospora suis]|uniref:Uncharacterized protein n=1 Tax=Cystoisospora suis TaxID=483139 RepID=A0A2C6KQM7_9APIC|nr:hypothetical protein CSUI_007535 [Cystoisospora suis]
MLVTRGVYLAPPIKQGFSVLLRSSRAVAGWLCRHELWCFGGFQSLYCRATLYMVLARKLSVLMFLLYLGKEST